MKTNRSSLAKSESSRITLLNAALSVIRTKGYAATSVDELCAAAGVSKGAFFHNFASKEVLAVEAASHWSEVTGGLFAEASYHDLADPLDRVMGYIDLRAELLDGPVEEFTCLVGTMVQEAFGSSDAIRAACEASITGHAQKLESDISEAFAAREITGVSARGLALHSQAVLQGAFILAKAMGGPDVARESVAHLKRYFEMLFNPQAKIERKQK
jgi:TetR/AcrR family transcriptional regulator, transcriptional repressor for nem operon